MYHLFFVIALLISILSCEKSDRSTQDSVIDYSNQEHWLSLPTDNPKEADVFYVCPTAWYKTDPAESNYCAIDNPMMLIGSQSAFNRQATAFATVGNIYAPYYRQADAGFILSKPEGKRWDIIDSIPAKDVVAAFDYFIKHYNNRRPYILVGHSQGANALLFVLKDYMKDHPEVYSRMVCAYVIGYPVTAVYMNENKHLKFAEGADDTGVIVSYNTQSPSVAPGSNIVVGNIKGIVINPINWRRDETLAPASANLGSYLPVDSQGNSGKIMNVADAKVNLAKGVVECSSVDENAMYKISGAMGLGVYHSFDIPFYYYNLRENAERRVNNFLEK